MSRRARVRDGKYIHEFGSATDLQNAVDFLFDKRISAIACFPAPGSSAYRLTILVKPGSPDPLAAAADEFDRYQRDLIERSR